MPAVRKKNKPVTNAIDRAREFGIDISLIEENLKRTPTERLEAMISMLEFTEEARAALARQRNKNPE